MRIGAMRYIRRPHHRLSELRSIPFTDPAALRQITEIQFGCDAPDGSATHAYFGCSSALILRLQLWKVLTLVISLGIAVTMMPVVPVTTAQIDDSNGQ